MTWARSKRVFRVTVSSTNHGAAFRDVTGLTSGSNENNLKTLLVATEFFLSTYSFFLTLKNYITKLN